MDRGNRQTIVASTLLTLTTLVFCHDTSYAQNPSSQTRQIQQGASNSGGLFSGLFGGKSTSSSKSTSRVVKPVNDGSRQEANWDGIPFHEARRTGQPQASTPIRDPRGQRESAGPLRDYIPNRAITNSNTSDEPRIVRTQPARTVPLANNSNTSTSTRRSIPTPGGESEIQSATTRRSATSTTTAPDAKTELSSPGNLLSSSTSSRRSDRRNVGTLDSAEVVQSTPAPAVAPKPMVSQPAPEPKVARRELPSVTKKQTVTPDLKKVAETLPEKTSVAKTEQTPRYSTPTNIPSDSVSTDEEEPLGSVPAVPYAASAPDPSYVTEDSEGFQPRQNIVTNTPAPAFKSDLYHSASSKPTTDFAPRVPSGDVATLRRNNDVLKSEISASTQSLPGGAAVEKTETKPADAVTNFATTVLPITAATGQEKNVDAGGPTLEPLRSSTANAGSTNAFTQTVPGKPAVSAAPTTANVPAVESVSAAPNNPIAEQAPAADAVPSEKAPADTTFAIQPGQSTVASELPGIRVVTHGPKQITIRQSHPYEIRIENRGSINASDVIVRAHIPSWAEVQGSSASRGDVTSSAQSGESERLVWTIDNLPAGGVERMFVRLKAVRSGSHDMNVDWTLAPQKSSATVFVQEPKVAVTIDGPAEVIYGQSQTYKVRISNPGDGVAPNVMFTLSPNSATPQTQRIGDIPAGKEAQIEVELTAQDLGDLKINGLAAGDLELRAEASKTIRVAAAKLQATLTGPQVKYQNTESMYVLQLKNDGTATSEQIVASLRLPVGVKYLGGVEAATQRADLLTWKIDAMAPGTSRDYQFRCNMTATGEQMFAFDARGTAAGQTNVALTTRVEAIADLVLAVNDPSAPAPVGSEVTYEIVIRNRGSKEATEVRAVAQFSNGIEPQQIEGHTGKVITGQVIFDAIPRIAAGEQVVLRIIAKAEVEGHHRFRTEVTSGDTVLVAEEATHYMSPQSERVSRHSDEPVTR